MPAAAVAVDTTAFDDEITRALAAFRTDVSYAVNMARAAVTIEKKRSAGARRKESKGASL